MDRQRVGDILLSIALLASMVLLVVVGFELGVTLLLAVLRIIGSMWLLLLVIVALAIAGVWLRNSPGPRE